MSSPIMQRTEGISFSIQLTNSIDLEESISNIKRVKYLTDEIFDM